MTKRTRSTAQTHAREDAQIRAAYQKGLLAYYQGVPFDQNPNISDLWRDAWERGWLKAKERAEAEDAKKGGGRGDMQGFIYE